MIGLLGELTPLCHVKPFFISGTTYSEDLSDTDPTTVAFFFLFTCFSILTFSFFFLFLKWVSYREHTIRVFYYIQSDNRWLLLVNLELLCDLIGCSKIYHFLFLFVLSFQFLISCFCFLLYWVFLWFYVNPPLYLLFCYYFILLLFCYIIILQSLS